MLIKPLLLDAAPDPVSNPVAGVGLILIGIIVLLLIAAAAIGLVFLIRWKTRRKLTRTSSAPVRTVDFHSSNPNQP